MRIFVEGSSLLKERSGVGQFAKRLVESYVKKYPQDKVIIFGFKFFTQGDYAKPIEPRENLSYRVVRWMPGRVYNMLFRMGLALPVDLFLRRRPDVIIYPNFLRWPVLNRKTKTVVMIHDLSFVHFPQYANPINLSDTTRFVPRSIAKSSHIITISQSSEHQIMEHFKVPAEKISIVYPAVDVAFFNKRTPAEVGEIRLKYKLPEKYLLFTGTLEPRKNITGLLMAYELLPQKTRGQYALVLAGGKGWQNQEIFEYIDSLRQKKLNIILTGYVDDADLPAIYTGASLFVWPSHYEGFGIPILEAMACGVPVITANNSSLPEAAGDAAILLDPNDTAGISSAIQDVLSDKALQKTLVASGYEQIKKFTWEKSADQLKDALEKC